MIKEALNTFSPVYDLSTVSTPGRKTIEVVVKLLLTRIFAVRIGKHKIIRIFQQSAVTGREGVSIQGE